MPFVNIQCGWTPVLLTVQPLLNQTLMPLGASGVTITSDQHMALNQLLKSGGHSIDLYTKKEKTIINVGEFHIKNRRQGRAIQKVVQSFPLQGIECLLGTKEAAEKGRLTGTNPLASLGVYLGLYGSGIAASILNNLGIDHFRAIQTELKTCLEQNVSMTDENHALTVWLSAARYSREVLLDKTKALTLVSNDLDSLEGQTEWKDAFNADYSLLLLEEAHRLSLFEQYELVAIHLLILSSALSLVMPVLDTSPTGANQKTILNSLGFMLGAPIVGRWLYHWFSHKPMPRDTTMAKNADHFMMHNPPHDQILTVMGRGHVRGFHHELTRNHGWQHRVAGTIRTLKTIGDFVAQRD